MSYKYFINPFAEAGDRATIPDDVQPSGSVSYAEGFGIDYELDQTSNPNAKDVPRPESNELYYQMTLALQWFQQWGVPRFITSADNGGVAFPYEKNAYALYDPGTGLQVYQSLVNSNTALPTDTTKWALIDDSNGATISGVQSLQYNHAQATGTANAIIATLTPPPIVDFGKITISAAATNTGPTTIDYGYGPKNIVKYIPGGATSLSGGEIIVGLDYDIMYHASGAYILNPSPVNGTYVTPTQLREQTYTAYQDTGTVNNVVVTPSPAYPNPILNLTQIDVFIANANTSAATLTVNGQTADIVKKPPMNFGGVTLTGGELVANTIATFKKNSNTGKWELQNPAIPSTLIGGVSLAGTQTISPTATDPVNFDTPEANSYLTATPPTVLAPIYGYYRVTVNLAATTTSAGPVNLFVYLTVNGSIVRTLATSHDLVAIMTGNIDILLSPGDEVGVSVFNASAGILTLANTTNMINSNFLELTLIGAAH